MTRAPSTVEELLAQAAPDDVPPAPLAAIRAGARRRRTRRRAGITLAGVAVVALACAPSLLTTGTSTMHSFSGDESSGDTSSGDAKAVPGTDSAATSELPAATESAASESGAWQLTLETTAAVPAPASAADDVAPDEQGAGSPTFTAAALPIEATLSSTRLRVADTCGEVTFVHTPALATRTASAGSAEASKRLAVGTREVRLVPADGPGDEGATTCRAVLAEVERSAATVTEVQVVGADTVIYQDAAGRAVLVAQRTQED